MLATAAPSYVHSAPYAHHAAPATYSAGAYSAGVYSAGAYPSGAYSSGAYPSGAYAYGPAHVPHVEHYHH